MRARHAVLVREVPVEASIGLEEGFLALDVEASVGCVATPCLEGVEVKVISGDGLETVRALMGTAADLGEYATTQELIADIVTLAIATTKSPHWPAGHSVSMEHIRATRKAIL